MNNDLILYQILSTTCNSLRKCMEISRENFYVDIGNLRGRGEARYFVIWVPPLAEYWSTSYWPILCQHVS